MRETYGDEKRSEGAEKENGEGKASDKVEEGHVQAFPLPQPVTTAITHATPSITYAAHAPNK